MATSVYTWNDPQKRVLKLEYTEPGSATVTSYVPAVVGTDAYTTYLAWLASGKTTLPYQPAAQGYGTVAEAKATRIAKLEDEVIDFIHDNFEYDILREQFHSGHIMAGETRDKIDRIFIVAEALKTAINASSDISAIRAAKADFLNLYQALGS